jgi:outer membrane beta-barrel protein
MKKLLIGLLALSSLSFASTETRSDLERKMDTLNIPSDKVTPLISEEKLYSVNSRYSSLKQRFEVSFFGASNLTPDSHIDSTMGGGTVRFHVNDKWSLGYRYSEYNNELTEGGEKLFERDEVLPDTDYAIKSNDAFINYNTVYGKLRLTSNTVAYFDQYISLGYGKIALGNGETQFYSIDVGLALWIGKKMSARFGVNNQLYEQHKLNGAENVHNAQGYVSFGYLFGEGSSRI